MDALNLPRPAWMSEDLVLLEEQARRFIADEFVPHLDRWHEAHIYDRDVWTKAGEAGLLCASMLAPADALQFLLKGDQLKVDRAKAMKLIDAVVPQADLIRAAKDWIKAGGKAKAPWDTEGFRLPGGPVYSKAGMMTFPAANAIYRRETYDNYPAARAILQVVYEGLQLPMDTALRVESRWFAKILRSPEAAAMIRSLFVSMQDLNKGARRPPNEPPTSLRKIGVVGAGFMRSSR